MTAKQTTALRWLRRAAVALLVLAVLAAAGFVAWTRLARYPAFPEAAALAAQARTAGGVIAFEPQGPPRAGLIFYPGGLVDPAAYAPLMERLSEDGVLAVIVPMPLDLAVFGPGRADAVIAAYPGTRTWLIAGHSLGGAMAAEYVKRNPDAVEGLVLLGAYPAESTDLSELAVAALSVWGSEDGVAGDVFESSLERLPPDARAEVIDGGNHAQFGYYGPQKGDGQARITRAEQQRRTAEAILRLIDALAGG